MSHRVTVMRTDTDNWDVVVLGGHDDSCKVWWECMEDHDDGEEDYNTGFYTYHGVKHIAGESGWAVESNDCALVATDSGRENLLNWAEDKESGMYEVWVDYEGDDYWYVTSARGTETE